MRESFDAERVVRLAARRMLIERPVRLGSGPSLPDTAFDIFRQWAIVGRVKLLALNSAQDTPDTWRRDMPKQGVVPDELTRPFWDAANQGRLVIQHCRSCDRLQHPPAPTCRQCRSGDSLEWKEMSGRGTIYNYGVVYDCPVRLLQEDQPFNVAVIMLDEDPGHPDVLPPARHAGGTKFRSGPVSRWCSRRPPTARKSPSGGS